ncbi:HAMP domain-containing histidine kinase [Kitasatospora sp. NBC_00085]|uniref:sensor histidine kinase n=1 Tax=unclassified Kitasatospora TaxID=2633591 RepID=UPI003245E7A9
MSDTATPPPPPLAPPRVPRRQRLVRWYRAQSLRSRLTFLTAAAVAVAIALSALACWFIVEQRLYDQVDRNLATAAPSPIQDGPPGVKPPQRLLQDYYWCAPTPSGALAAATAAAAATAPGNGGRIMVGAPRWSVQVISPDGQPCLPTGATHAITLTSSDLQAPQGSARLGHYTYRDGTFTTGEDVRVRVSTFAYEGKVYGYLVADPVAIVEESLNQLAIILGGVAVGGIILAGLAGRLVARSALKPVDRLTDVVEHIARTEEVGTTIPVQGSDEIARLSASFNSMSTALANSRDRQTRLIADAGHELRTPLTSLRTNVDLLIRSDDTGRPLPPATKTKLLGNMKAQMQELTLLIGDLLQLSRPDSPKPVRSLAVVALHEIAERAVARAKLRGPGLVFETAVAPWFVRGDAAALERAVINLLDNAVKYSPPGGTIEVGLQQGVLTVRDHGPGIPPDELQYVFDRFWRSPSSRQLPGSGLGLSIVAQSVRESGGEVSLGPAQDGGPGALATVRLPGGPAPT